MEYVCVACGEVFETPRILKEYHPETQPGWWETAYRSPCCEEGFVRKKICAECGGGNNFDEVGKLCSACAHRAGDRLGRFLMEEFTEEEREALDVLFEGISFSEIGKEGMR